jgi:hypothetical protein
MANEMDGFDLRKFQEEGEEKDKIKKIMGKVLSGREGYEMLEEKKSEKIPKCECGWPIEAGAKFCSECGTAARHTPNG